MRLVLASASPRRRDLLAHAGFDVDVQPVDLDERPLPGELAEAYVGRLAAAKADACRAANPGRYIVGADTTVVLDGQMLGKPRDDDEARKMLKMLSGRWHDVVTGVVVYYNDRHGSEVARTAVRFVSLTDADVQWYVARGESRDKAGAYAVQGLASRFVDRIDGSYSNVVGLPIAIVHRLLCEMGWSDRGSAAGAVG